VKHGCGGKQRTRAYYAWVSMNQRCANPRSRDFPNYGGRGIAVCESWRDFRAFLADMGEPPAGTSLDRVDNALGYSAANCRWATPATQRRNCRAVRALSFAGRDMLVGDWERELGLSQGAIYHRLRKGWSLEKALTTRRAA
jgi:hypothetical protein